MNQPVTELDQRFSDPDAMAAAGMKAGSSGAVAVSCG
jgi:hypothetical protein